MRLTQVLLLATIASCLLAAKASMKKTKAHKSWDEPTTPRPLSRTEIDLEGIDASSIEAIAEGLLGQEASQADFDSQRKTFGRFLSAVEPESAVFGYNWVAPTGRAADLARALLANATQGRINDEDLADFTQRIATCQTGFAFQANPPNYRDYLEIGKIFTDAHYILVSCADPEKVNVLWIGGSVNGILRPEYEDLNDEKVDAFVSRWLRRSIFLTILKRCPVA